MKETKSLAVMGYTDTAIPLQEHIARKLFLVCGGILSMHCSSIGLSYHGRSKLHIGLPSIGVGESVTHVLVCRFRFSVHRTYCYSKEGYCSPCVP